MRASRSEHRVAGVTMTTAKAVATSTTTSNVVSAAAHDTDGSVWRHGALVGKKAAPMCENLLIALYLTLKPLDLKPNLVSLKRSHTKFVRSPRRQNERGRPETVVHPGRGQESSVSPSLALTRPCLSLSRASRLPPLQCSITVFNILSSCLSLSRVSRPYPLDM